MKFVVAIKQVPLRDSPLRVAASGVWIDEANLQFEINEPDAYALEEALQLREKHGGEVVVLCAGPQRAGQTIREALAKGADRAIHVETSGAALDTLATARLLADAVKSEAPDLILTGLQSDDLGYGQTGVVLAELLGMPHSTIIMQVEIRDGGTLRVKRELEDGWFQHIEMPLPAVLTIQSGLNKLRYATLMGIKKAKTKEVRVIKAEAGSPSPAVIEKIYAPEKSKQAQIFTGDAKTAATQLIEKLKFEARVL
jgi:electron transfer flavoprotein beta subunit